MKILNQIHNKYKIINFDNLNIIKKYLNIEIIKYENINIKIEI